MSKLPRHSSLLPLLLLLAPAPPLAAQTVPKQNVLTQHNDGERTGANLHETQLTPANVSAQTFGMIAKHAVDDQLYTQPLVLTGVKVNGGLHDLVFVTTVNNSVYAFDANDRTGTDGTAADPIWHVNFGTPANLHDADFGCLDMNGNFGIVGTPVIDAPKNDAPTNGQPGVLYVVVLAKAAGGFTQRLHALDVATGSDLPNSPVTLTAPDFNPLMQNQRPALALAGGAVLIGYASHCDKLPYTGFLFSYDAHTLTQRAVLNTAPGGEGASIWQSGQAPAVDAAGNIYVVTGNGSWNGSTQFSESFLKLDANLRRADWFTPTNHVYLDQKDQDLDSSGATLIPGTSLVLGGGKEGVLYTLDTRKFGGLGDEHAVQHFKATGSHLHSLVYWNSAAKGQLLYVWGQRDKARVYRLAGDKLTETPVMTRSEANQGHPGAMLSLSANGQKDGILWAAIHATGDSWHESRPGILHAYAADDINHELWNSLENKTRDDCGNYSKMAPPTIANGKVYLASFGTRNTGSGQFCVYGLLPGSQTGKTPEAPSGLNSIVSGRFVELTWPPVASAETYTVEKLQHGVKSTVASGLTTPAFTDFASLKDPATYTVRASSPQGASPWSSPIQAIAAKAPMARMDH